MGSVLAVPACGSGSGRGGGHLVRCMALVRGLRALGRDAWLALPDDAGVNSLLDTADFDRAWLITEAGLQGKNWECIILDRFQSTAEELARWEQLAPVIGIDEGGPCRNRCDFLIDILPNCNPIAPNTADPTLLPLPEKKALPSRPENAPLRVLVSFGQEDAAGLGPAAARALASNTGLDITLVKGKLGSGENNTAPHITVIEGIPHLSEHLGEYDLVITHYGLTSFEALYAGVPVLLVSPTGYHEKLAQAAGFFSLGAGKEKAARLERLLFTRGGLQYPFLANLKKRCAALAAQYRLDSAPGQSLAELVNSFAPSVSRVCPACGGATGGAAIARFSERSYYRCKRCGVIGMNRLNPPPIEYAREYFFEHYRKQYGKTYIEDFPNLSAMAQRRLAVINSISSRRDAEPPLLLDIGCAYGPFLAAARDKGFAPQGIDPAEDAVRYVTQELGIPAVQGYFPNAGNGERSPNPSAPYAVITLWYVIEHFRDCVPALAEIYQLLKPGGVLAFATPSFSGVSGRASLRRFLEHSPADHWTVWSPASCGKALEAAGFTVKKIIVSGHHPERFPLLGKYARSKKSPLYWPLLAISTIFGLGDTFEVYAVRQ